MRYEARVKRTSVALIDEARCIGCTRCIDACPVDAIAGAQSMLHTVIAAYCTGCELCLPPCPVDCIDLVPPPGPWRREDTLAAKTRARRRQQRLVGFFSSPSAEPKTRQALIASAILRAGVKKIR
ncbi:MAG: RnfABCDGE type electron transport complex subunit B [Betaproteobacteria bacterium]|nr:RnfABCDGE type electron transport complex subunit B [Betaproteobacteria bacterium]MSQ87976.1 RnfABCDGE type electron transport complex subunit B [Betaproteobacteria bacterium]